MIIATPALWLPPSIEQHVRGSVSWREYQRQREWVAVRKMLDDPKLSVFPFPFFLPKTSGGNDADTLLLLHMDGTNGSTTFTDSSVSALTITRQGSAQLATSTPSPKFGTASCNLNTGGFSWSSTAFNDITTFTIDFWGYNLGTLKISSAYAATFVRFYLFSLGLVYASSNGSSWNVINGVATNLTAPSNTWTHYAFVCDGTNMKIYQDGTQAASIGYTITTGTTGTWAFGGAASGGYASTGFLDEFRWSKTVRWTGSFTPSWIAYT